MVPSEIMRYRCRNLSKYVYLCSLFHVVFMTLSVYACVALVRISGSVGSHFSEIDFFFAVAYPLGVEEFPCLLSLTLFPSFPLVGSELVLLQCWCSLHVVHVLYTI